MAGRLGGQKAWRPGRLGGKGMAFGVRLTVFGSRPGQKGRRCEVEVGGVKGVLFEIGIGKARGGIKRKLLWSGALLGFPHFAQ